MDGEDTITNGGEVMVGYGNDDIIFPNDTSFDLLASEGNVVVGEQDMNSVASASLAPHDDEIIIEDHEQQFISSEQMRKWNQTYGSIPMNRYNRPKLTQVTNVDKLHRTIDGVQRTTTINPIGAGFDRSYIDETRRAVNSVTALEDVSEVAGPNKTGDQIHPDVCHNQHPIDIPPHGFSGSGENCLQRLKLLIGKKSMVLRVINKDKTNYCADLPDRFAIGKKSAQNGKFKCSTCMVHFVTKTDWSRHMIVYHEQAKPFICVVCGMGFSSKTSLSIHHRSHSPYRSITCNICNKSFTRVNNYQTHMNLHRLGDRHFCDSCGRCFKSLEQMQQHVATCAAVASGEYIQTDRPMRYQCSFCPRLFHHKRDKFIHERVHTGEKPYQCGYCGRGFTQSQGLTIHIRLHTGEKPFSCEACGRTFRDNSALRKHELRHVMERMDDGDGPGEEGIYEEQQMGMDEPILDDVQYQWEAAQPPHEQQHLQGTM